MAKLSCSELDVILSVTVYPSGFIVSDESESNGISNSVMTTNGGPSSSCTNALCVPVSKSILN